MGCASSIVPQQQQQRRQQQHQNPHPGPLARPKHKMNALVPEPPTRPTTAVPAGPRVGLVSPALLGNPTSTPTLTSSVKDPHNYEELCVAFLKAVKSGDVPAMETLAQLAVKLKPTPQSLVNIRGMWDSTPLVYATQYVHSAAAHWLLARGADVLAQNEKGVTPLLLASLEGMTDVCEKILAVAALMGSSNPLLSASSVPDDRGQTSPRPVDQQIGVVYNSAADINVRLSPLLAASMNGHAGVVALLLMHGADPNRPVGANAGGIALSAKQYALLLAAKYGHGSVLELLLAHGADCSVRDGGGSHAVLLACENRREDCAMKLLRRLALESADTENPSKMMSVWMQPNRHGITALHSASTHGLASAAAALVAHAREQTFVDGDPERSQKRLRAFIDAASITRGETALLMACRKRQFEVAKVLLEAGADPRRPDRGGTTAVQVLERCEQSDLLTICESANFSTESSNSTAENCMNTGSPVEVGAGFTNSAIEYEVCQAKSIPPEHSIESTSAQGEASKPEEVRTSSNTDRKVIESSSDLLNPTEGASRGQGSNEEPHCENTRRIDNSSHLPESDSTQIVDPKTSDSAVIASVPTVSFALDSDTHSTVNEAVAVSTPHVAESHIPATAATTNTEEVRAIPMGHSQTTVQPTDTECTPIVVPELNIVGLESLSSLDSMSPLREPSEYGGDGRTSSNVSVSPKKEKRKKPSKRKKQRDGDQDHSPSSSPPRHHRRHRHRVAEEITEDVGDDNCFEVVDRHSHRRYDEDTNR